MSKRTVSARSHSRVACASGAAPASASAAAAAGSAAAADSSSAAASSDSAAPSRPCGASSAGGGGDAAARGAARAPRLARTEARAEQRACRRPERAATRAAASGAHCSAASDIAWERRRSLAVVRHEKCCQLGLSPPRSLICRPCSSGSVSWQPRTPAPAAAPAARRWAPPSVATSCVRRRSPRCALAPPRPPRASPRPPSRWPRVRRLRPPPQAKQPCAACLAAASLRAPSGSVARGAAAEPLHRAPAPRSAAAQPTSCRSLTWTSWWTPSSSSSSTATVRNPPRDARNRAQASTRNRCSMHTRPARPGARSAAPCARRPRCALACLYASGLSAWLGRWRHRRLRSPRRHLEGRHPHRRRARDAGLPALQGACAAGAEAARPGGRAAQRGSAVDARRGAQGKRLVFVTNNSTKSRAGYTSKFKSLGLNVTAVRRRHATHLHIHG